MNLLADILESVMTDALVPSRDDRSRAPLWARIASIALAVAVVAWLIWG